MYLVYVVQSGNCVGPLFFDRADAQAYIERDILFEFSKKGDLAIRETICAPVIDGLLELVDKTMDRMKDEYFNQAMTELAFVCPFDQLSWEDKQLVEWVAAVRKHQANAQSGG